MNRGRRRARKGKLDQDSDDSQGKAPNVFQVSGDYISEKPENVFQEPEPPIKIERQCESYEMESDAVPGEPLEEAPYPYMQSQGGRCFLIQVVCPHFRVVSVTFLMTVVSLALFLTISLLEMSRPESGMLRSCTLFRLKAKFLPTIKVGAEYYRLFLPFFYHSSVAQLVVNLIPVTLYGYAVERHFRPALLVALPFAMVLSALGSSLLKPANVSVTSSAFVYLVIGLKLFFLVKFWNSPYFQGKKTTLCALLLILAGLGLLPVFTDVNVDIASVLAGLGSGWLVGLAFRKADSKLDWLLRVGAVLLLLGAVVALGVQFGKAEGKKDLAETITELCRV